MEGSLSRATTQGCQCRLGGGRTPDLPPPLAPFSSSSACSELSSATQCAVVSRTNVTVLIQAGTLCLPHRISQQQRHTYSNRAVDLTNI